VTELDALLELAGKRGYLWYGSVGVCEHSECADVFVFSDREHAHAYRLPTDADTDLFTPVWVCWWYAANPVWTLRALLTLPEPGAPETLVPAPPGLGVQRS
jgi:hypothetical protein